MKGKAIYGWTTTLMVLAIVVVANAVSSNFFKRLDLTEGRIFSLYPASKRVVGELDDNFLVKAYFSKNLPAPYNTNAKFVQDKLEEYKRSYAEFVDELRRAGGGVSLAAEQLDRSGEEVGSVVLLRAGHRGSRFSP